MLKPPGKTLSLQERAFLIGYRKGLNFARSEMRQMAKAFEKMIREMRREQQRYKDIHEALKAQPGPDDIWLN
jgi:hypothetical protein